MWRVIFSSEKEKIVGYVNEETTTALILLEADNQFVTFLIKNVHRYTFSFLSLNRGLTDVR